MSSIKEQVVSTDISGEFKPDPGMIYSDIPNILYHSERLIPSSSGLKKIRKETLFHYFDDPALETKAMSLGDDYHGALDCSVSGTDINDHVIMDGSDKATLDKTLKAFATDAYLFLDEIHP